MNDEFYAFAFYQKGVYLLFRSSLTNAVEYQSILEWSDFVKK